MTTTKCKCSPKTACDSMRCSCKKSNQSCSDDCECSGYCKNPMGMNQQNVSAAEFPIPAVVMESFNDLKLSEPESIERAKEENPVAVTVFDGCYYACQLMDAIGTTGFWPKNMPALKGQLRDAVKNTPWKQWTERREWLRGLTGKQTAETGTGEVHGMVLHVVKPSALAYVQFEISKELVEKYLANSDWPFSDGSTLQFINVVPLASLKTCSSPIWHGCKGGCGGMHTATFPCPQKLERIHGKIKAECAEAVDGVQPRFYCAFGGCEEEYHETRKDCCAHMESLQRPYLDHITNRMNFELQARRVTVRILSWNTQRMYCALNLSWFNRGFSSLEKRNKVGFANARRPHYEEEKQLRELLLQHLKDDIKRIQPDIICLQEVPIEDDPRYHFRVLGLDETLYDCRGFEQKETTKATGDNEENGAGTEEEDTYEQANPAEEENKPEQHVFFWRKETMTHSKNPQEYLPQDGLKFKHGAPTMGFTHSLSGKCFIITSLHLECGGKFAPGEVGYKAAITEFTNLIRNYRTIPKPALFSDSEWTTEYERKKVDAGEHIHVCAGDLNLNPHKLMEVDPELSKTLVKNNLLVTGSKYTVTNAGKAARGYDFFLTDETVQRFAGVRQSVLRFSFGKSGGNIGLSDHDPVVLEFDFHERLLDRKTFREKHPPMD